jgi:hypothetical protein
MSFEQARKVADAVLYEGYVLYPYRASSRKNQIRWQFGVLAPRGWCEAGGPEHWWMQTESLVELRQGSKLAGKVRFLQVQQRRVEQALDFSGEGFSPVESIEVDGRLWTTWDEGAEQEVDFVVQTPGDGRDLEAVIPFEFAGTRWVEPIAQSSGGSAGRLVRERQPLAGVLRLQAQPLNGDRPLLQIRILVENITPCTSGVGERDQALRSSFVGVHTLLSVQGGEFLSLLDPPEWAKSAAASCQNVRTWPVLVGEQGDRRVMLSSPIILYDYPSVAPESAGDLYDCTEIDEILTLRTMALTEAEKQEARATDPRAAAIIDRVDTLPPQMMEKLHGTIRYLREQGRSEPGSAQPPWWDPASDRSVSPETDSIQIGGVRVYKGSRVLLRPGVRRADAQDMFLNDRIAIVQGVFFDVEGKNYLAVTLEEDPNAELFQSHGRYLYFQPDEVVPLEERR